MYLFDYKMIELEMLSHLREQKNVLHDKPFGQTRMLKKEDLIQEFQSFFSDPTWFKKQTKSDMQILLHELHIEIHNIQNRILDRRDDRWSRILIEMQKMYLDRLRTWGFTFDAILINGANRYLKIVGSQLFAYQSNPNHLHENRMLHYRE